MTTTRTGRGSPIDDRHCHIGGANLNGGTGMFALATGWRVDGWVLTELGKRDAAIDKLKKDAGPLIEAVDGHGKLTQDELRRSLEVHKLYAVENSRQQPANPGLK